MHATRWAAALAAPALLATAPLAPARGQLCFGIPTRDGGGALAVEIAFPRDAIGYGGQLRLDAPGSLVAGASYAVTSFDYREPDAYSFGTDLGIELPLGRASACPFAGVGYSRLSDESSKWSGWAVSLGVGFGTRLVGAQGVALIGHATPRFYWVRASAETRFGDRTRETDTEAALTLGLTLAIQRVFLGGSLFLTTEDESKPVLSVGLGVTF